ncbi:MAG: FAD-dependent monooxygenase [Betaproteobacteria bacterium]|nr:FAD-dependent monooxygenase [Betaproteobacteria bacterium]
MSELREVPVLIVGGGPAGATLAAELGWRGAGCLMVDETDGSNAHPRANMAGQRSMEIFRRWGLADRVLAASLPPEYPIDVIFTTRLNGHEIHRFALATTASFQSASEDMRARLPDVDWSPYFKTQIGQNYIEPVVCAYAAGLPGVEVRHNWRLAEFTQDAGGVTARIERTDGGASETVRAKYLVGCDGGRSQVRRTLGIPFTGRGALAHNQSIYFDAPEFLKSHPRGPGTLLWTLAPDLRGVFITIDGNSRWTYNTYFFKEDGLDPAERVCRAIGRKIEVNVLSVQPWTGYQVVAERYRQGRVFLCGDSAHLFNPTGGFGMNTAIADAADLGWKLAAVFAGWGGEGLLDSYEIERRPVGVRNTLEAASNFDRVATLMALPEWIEEDSERGRAARAEAAANIQSQKKTWSASGMHLGYRYEGSPLVVPDGTPPTPDTAQVYHPTTRPGSRAPHVWLADGRSTLDLVPRQGYALFRFDGGTAQEPFSAAAAERGLPFTVHAIAEPRAAELYERRYVLVRPDGHVAWRGDTLPVDAGPILDVARGLHVPAGQARADRAA